MIRNFLFLVAGLLTLDMSATASPSAWRVAPREAWVQDAPRAARAAQAPSAGLQLHDRQIRVTAIGDDRYEHTILRVATAQTGEEAAQVYVGVDPRFQELVIHSLRLTHAGEIGRVFTAAQIRVQVTSQPAEAEPRKREFNPLLQISIQVPGVQAGDILECEYTVHSRAALFPGLFVGHYAAQWAAGGDQPVLWERLHVIWPPERPLRFWISGGLSGDAPKVETHAGELDVQWQDLAPAAAESDTPQWFQRQSTVQLSDFADWTAVATILAPQYRGGDADQQPLPMPSVEPTPDMILKALRLLQSKVHAISVVGDAPYAPAEPAVVLQRGYGDSRDLARVLASLLRRLGIDAQVALADSRRGALLESALPSPFLLDTALVLVRAGANEYWLNPSAADPAAALDTTDLADLRHALIIAASGGKIVALPEPAPDSRLRSVTQQFDLRAGNLRPATLTVTTQFQGSWAQAVRADLLTQTQAQLQLAQIQEVAQDYPAASADGEVQLQAAAGSPTVQIAARFRIPRPFGDADRQFNFFAEALAEAVMPRDESTRRVPLGLPWPLKLEEHIVADLPPHYTAPIGRTVIATSAFRFQRDVRFMQGALHIDHSYVALADHVDPIDYPAFLQANAQVYQALGVRVLPEAFTWRSALEWLGSHWLGIFVTAAVVAAAAAAGWRQWRVSD